LHEWIVNQFRVETLIVQQLAIKTFGLGFEILLVDEHEDVSAVVLPLHEVRHVSALLICPLVINEKVFVRVRNDCSANQLVKLKLHFLNSELNFRLDLVNVLLKSFNFGVRLILFLEILQFLHLLTQVVCVLFQTAVLRLHYSCFYKFAGFFREFNIIKLVCSTLFLCILLGDVLCCLLFLLIFSCCSSSSFGEHAF